MIPSEEDRLELALRASNEGIWQWFVDSQQVKYSERVLGFLDHTSGEAPNIFAHPDFYLHEDDLGTFKQAWDAILRVNGKELMAVDCRYRKSDGTFVWLRIRGACLRNETGVPVQIAGSIIDISRRKVAENALEEERHLLRQLIENIPNTIYFKDEESRFVMANQALAEKLGVSSDRDLLGKTDHDFFDAVHADQAREDELEIMRTKQPQKEAIERETWKGHEDTWVMTTKIPWLNGKGEVRGIFGVSSDVSEMVNVQVRLTNVASLLKYKNEEYEKELELARQVQQSVLDEKPLPFPRGESTSSNSLAFHTFYQPDSEMAGDFYEVFPISDTKAGVFICDVMGHGVRSSLVVAMLRGLIEKESDSAMHPEWFLYGLNDSLTSIFSHAGIQMFATALYIVIDLDSSTLEYASAGHPMPIVGKSGNYALLDSDKIVRGPALGITPEAPYGSDVVPLSEIDQIILYTDGIYEVENTNEEQLGVEALIDFLKAQDSAGVGNSIEAILQCARNHAQGEKFGDDICLLGMDIKHLPG